jgi:hypothetical protein
VPLGYVVALVAAAAFLVCTAYGAPPAGMAAMFVPPVAATVFFAGAASFVPAAIAILVAELFRLTSVLYFLLAGGAIGLLGFHFARMMEMFIVFHARPVAVPAAGIVGGFVYWLIARPGAEPAAGGAPADR